MERKVVKKLIIKKEELKVLKEFWDLFPEYDGEEFVDLYSALVEEDGFHEYDFEIVDD